VGGDVFVVVVVEGDVVESWTDRVGAGVVVGEVVVSCWIGEGGCWDLREWGLR